MNGDSDNRLFWISKHHTHVEMCIPTLPTIFRLVGRVDVTGQFYTLTSLAQPFPHGAIHDVGSYWQSWTSNIISD